MSLSFLTNFGTNATGNQGRLSASKRTVMKSSFLLWIFLSTFLNSFSNAGIQEVNAILGDKSFVYIFGRSPNQGTEEVLRIQTHLAYVERFLEAKTRTALDSRQQLNRKAVLSLLHEYWTAGIFPSNYDFPSERMPCFIDRKGNICAVGYLIEKTVGRNLAEQINARHKYEFILQMNEPLVDEWAKEYGLTLEECAMIQPAYWPPTPPEPITRSVEIKSSYGISSGVVSGMNLVATISNFSHTSSTSNTVAYVGLFTGAAQIVLGATNIKEQQTTYFITGQEVTDSYKAQNNLSYVNIAMGTTAVLSSTLRLLLNKKNKDVRNAYNIYSYPNQNNSISLGFSMKRRI
jgi:hypothetical protein